jgi:hypothetical protein
MILNGSYMCLHAFSFHRESPDPDPGRRTHFWGGSITLWFKKRQVVPKKEELKKKILDEAHTLRYSIHPESTKMYHDLR